MPRNLSAMADGLVSANAAILMLCALVATTTGVLLGIGWYAALPTIALPVLILLYYPLVSTEKAVSLIACTGGLVFIGFVVWPRYGYLRIGGLPGITPPRVLLLIFLLQVAVGLAKSAVLQRIFVGRLRDSFRILCIFGIYFFFRLGSAVLSDTPFASLLFLVDEIVFLGGAFLIGVLLLPDRLAVLRFAWLVSMATFLVSILALVEYFLQRNIFLDLLSVNNEYAQEALLPKIRDGDYRVQSTFDHPLTFAQFLNSAIPVSLILSVSAGTRMKQLFAAVVTGTALVAIFLTGSRSALGVLSFALLFIVGVVSLKQFFLRRVTLGGMLIAIALSASCFGILIGIEEYLLELLAGRSSAEASSTSARLIMLQRAIPLVLDNPLFGYGVGAAPGLVGFVGGRGIVTIDSLIISIVVESGAPALIAYAALLAAGIAAALRSSPLGTAGNLIGVGIAAGIFAFGATSVTLSLTANWFVLASFLAAGCAVACEGKSK